MGSLITAAARALAAGDFLGALNRVALRDDAPALARAEAAAREARIPALTTEVESAQRILSAPAARRITNGGERALLLEEVEELLTSKALIVDACRFVVRHEGSVISLARRPVLFALARAPGGGGDSGLAWAEGTLWVGQYRDRTIRQIDPETGAILRTIESNRFVTGASDGPAYAPRS